MKLIIPVITLAALALAGCSDSGGGDDQVTLDYTVTVTHEPGEDCAGDPGGFADIAAGGQVEVVDGDGGLLGVGHLAGPAQSEPELVSAGVRQWDCTYTATFPVDESDFYRVTSGNANRGYLTYSAEDVQDGTLTVAATLG